MAQPKEVTDIADELGAVMRRAWDELAAEQERILRNPSRTRRRARLRELRGSVEQLMSDVDDEARDWVNNRLTEAYAHGGIAGEVQQAFGWTKPHLDAVHVIAHDTYSDVLARTRYVRTDTKRFIREVSKETGLQQVLQGKTATQAGREIEHFIQEHGITAITYSDGSRHGLSEYGQMLARTKSATAYNEGTLNQAAHEGVKFWEILDGPFCGLTYHDDPTTANGMIVDRNTCSTYVISHPNCRRSFAPRPDIDTKRQAKAAEPFATEAQAEDIKRADALRQRRALRSHGRQQKRTTARTARSERHTTKLIEALKTPESQAEGEAFRNLREEKGLSRPELSQQTGISVARLHGIEHGVPLTPEDRAALERVLGKVGTAPPPAPPRPSPPSPPTPRGPVQKPKSSREPYDYSQLPSPTMVERVFNDRWKIKLNIQDMHYTVAREVGQTLDDLLRAHPEAVNHLRRFPQLSPPGTKHELSGGGVVAHVERVMGQGPSAIKIYDAYRHVPLEQTDRSLRRVMAGSSRTTQWTVTRSLGEVLTHEFGHVMDNVGDDIINRFSVTLTHIMDRAQAAGLIPGTGYRLEEVMRAARTQISQYASTNMAEVIAESFADVTLHGDNAAELSKIVYDEVVKSARGLQPGRR